MKGIRIASSSRCQGTLEQRARSRNSFCESNATFLTPSLSIASKNLSARFIADPVTAGQGTSIAAMRDALLAWYAANARELPWRHTRDPYAILVSEVMLQQTQVERVLPRYLRWLERWPTVEALAAATAADVIVEWQGLGYNRRAISLHRAACAVAHGGWPDDLTRAARRRAVHGRSRRQLRVRPRRPARRHERAPRAGADGRAVRRVVRAGALRPRRDRLPRSRPALPRMPARGRMPVARSPLRAVAQAVARSRARSGSGGPWRCARSPAAASPTTRMRSPRWHATASSPCRTAWRPCRASRARAARPPGPRAPRRGR